MIGLTDSRRKHLPSRGRVVVWRMLRLPGRPSRCQLRELNIEGDAGNFVGIKLPAIPGKQFVETVCRMLGDASNDVGV